MAGDSMSVMMDAIAASLRKKEYLVDSSKVKAVQSVEKQLLPMFEEEIFSNFSEEMVTLLKSCFKIVEKCSSNCKKSERLWVWNHQKATHEATLE